MDENEPKKSFKHKAMRFSGITFVTIGALTLLGWMQGRDPDCLLAEVETEFPTTYLRMCEMEIIDAPITWWPLAASIVVIVIGVVLIRLANKK